jgi:hypothetical protein
VVVEEIDRPERLLKEIQRSAMRVRVEDVDLSRGLKSVRVELLRHFEGANTCVREAQATFRISGFKEKVLRIDWQCDV